jgi:hypothetical protein
LAIRTNSTETRFFFGPGFWELRPPVSVEVLEKISTPL